MSETVLKEILLEVHEIECGKIDELPDFKPSLRHHLAMKRIFARFERNTRKLRKVGTIQEPPITEHRIRRYNFKQRILIATIIIILMTLLVGCVNVYDFYTSCQGENAKPFKKDEDILLAVKSANEESQLQTPLNTDNLEAWNWGVAGLEIRVSKRLSSKDFEGISIGSTIEEVTSVDPITAISQPGKNDWWKDESYTLLKFDTFHYTDDGILKVSFERKAIGEEFLVSDIELNKTFEVSYDGSSPVDGQPTVKLNINPEHLPD